MVMIARRGFLAAAASAVGAIALAGAPAAAQSAALRQAVLGFEDGVSWAAVSPT